MPHAEKLNDFVGIGPWAGDCALNNSSNTASDTGLRNRTESDMRDRFDVCEAYYWFGTLWHSGQGSKPYAYLGRLSRIKFKPSPAVEFGRLSHGAALVYDRLCREHGVIESGYRNCSCRDCFELCIDSPFCDGCESSECGLNQECKREDVGEDR